jgi:hypothetical protein
MSTYIKVSFITGIILTMLGCFLPWWEEGDFISYWRLGIRIYPSIENNGGLLVLLLIVILAVLIFQPPSFIEKPAGWVMALSIILALDIAFHIGELMIARSIASGVVGAPSIQIGLIMLIAGSMLLLLTSVLHYLKLL